MAKYLDTSQITSDLMQLLKDAKEKIILVTYSLQVNTQIQERLKTKSVKPIFDFSDSIYNTTKDLSEKTGITSRDINQILVNEGLMKKVDGNWDVTKEGKKYGGVEKDGQYGKFVVWSQEIIDLLEL